MSTCRDIQKVLAESFDSGRDLDAGVEEHLGSCVACSAYHETLNSLEADLFAMPLAVPSADLNTRIEGRIVRFRQERRWYGVLVGAAVCVLIVGLVGVGWWFPMEAYGAEWWSGASALFEGDVALIHEESLLLEEVATVWAGMRNMLGELNPFSDWMMYLSIASVLLIFFCFNGAEAWSLRNSYRLKERHQ